MQAAQELGKRLELLTPKEMAAADRLAAENEPHGSYSLMQNAGAVVARTLLARYPDAEGFDILCGPGNNGGDGYEAAHLLCKAGKSVTLWADGAPRSNDAKRAAELSRIEPHPLADFRPQTGRVVVDALYGAGFARSLEGAAAAAAHACNDSAACVVAIDLPSGLSGETGQKAGIAFKAELTVTFFRLKPGHLLEPGRSLCGEILLGDIGIADRVLETVSPRAFVNLPGLWRSSLPYPARDEHKYSRGHVAVFSGGMASTGAARLSAKAAARSGAGAVTVYTPGDALLVNAAHLTSIMLRRVDTPEDFLSVIGARRSDALVLGPGYGLDRPLRTMVETVLTLSGNGALVLDADGLTAFHDDTEKLFANIGSAAFDVVLTPHEGEFARLFPDLVETELSKLERTRQAAARAGAIIVLKGPDTVIAAPDGRAAININGSPFLATAGSGDVLAGLIAGFCAQKMPTWQAACAAVWLHARAASSFGPGLIAEDLPSLIPPVLGELHESTRDCSAMAPNGARGLPEVMK